MWDGRFLHFLTACFVHSGARPLNEPPPPLLHHLTERPWIQHFHPPALSSSPKMQWTSSAVVGVKLCINSLNALRHWFNISARALEVLTLSWTWIVLLWTAVLWLWVISCPFPSVTSGIWTKLIKKTFAFSQHKKVCAKVGLLSGGGCIVFFPPSLPCLSFLDLVLEGVYIVMISCWVLCVWFDC